MCKIDLEVKKKFVCFQNSNKFIVIVSALFLSFVRDGLFLCL